jgi:crossover junction endodeoxyribonuclease RuvC
VATRTGWAFTDDGGRSIQSGWWIFNQRNGESPGMRLIRFRGQLAEFVRARGTIDLIVYERPGGRNTLPIMVESEFLGQMKAFCAEHKIEFTPYSAPEIKSFATGKGNAKKELVVRHVQERWKANVTDDNEADAIALLMLALDRLGVRHG